MIILSQTEQITQSTALAASCCVMQQVTSPTEPQSQSESRPSLSLNASDSGHRHLHLASLEVIFNIFKCYIAVRVFQCYFGKSKAKALRHDGICCITFQIQVVACYLYIYCDKCYLCFYTNTI